MGNKDEDDNKNMNNFLTNYSYKGGFILTPEPKPVNTKAKYDHYGKDFAITNLRIDPRNMLDQPNQALATIHGLQVMTNPKHFGVERVKKLVYVENREYEQEVLDEKGNKHIIIVSKPFFEEREELVEETYFPLSYHLLESNLHALVQVAASTNGHRIKAAITERSEKEESVQDKTEVKPRGFFGGSGERK